MAETGVKLYDNILTDDDIKMFIKLVSSFRKSITNLSHDYVLLNRASSMCQSLIKYYKAEDFQTCTDIISGAMKSMNYFCERKDVNKINEFFYPLWTNINNFEHLSLKQHQEV